MFFRGISRIVGPLAAISLPIMCTQKRKHQVYLWGNGFYQARPDALLQFKNFTPVRLDGIPTNLVKLQLGELLQAGITEQGQLWIWDTQLVDANLDQPTDGKRKNVKKLAKNIKQVKFTNGYLWTLNQKKQVIQYPINKNQSNGQIIIGKQRQVKPLRGSEQIATGSNLLIYVEDHVLALIKGQIWALGDDTLGQCGMGINDRPTFPPFTQRRISYPYKIETLKDIVKINSGMNHSLAIDSKGGLYGWGSNASMQLSHQQQFSQMNTPLIAAFSPIRITKGLDNTQILDVKGGGDFTIIIGRNKTNQSYEVFSVGSNMKGQLGIGQIRHIRDVTKIQGLSNFVLKRNNKQLKIQISSLALGNSHAIAALNIGYIMQWGDNQNGQMGNKKRSSIYTPTIIKQFNQRQIIGVFAGENASGIILKQKNQQKRQNNKL